eukprot:TRINITY_DN989_c0_g1_i3.p1 TRINITY_DN989_c0_g1~~TRINITY_DN989_c0_g1_i3.p1  ORF type:complete len:138 (-),score=16.13 TRINITY_DN989_c0_g1_i3:28-441(-)
MIIQVLTSPDIILFGEWCYQKHSIHYTNLPDYFLAFDIYDKSVGKFLSVNERNRLLEGSGIHTVRKIAEGKFSKEKLLEFIDTESKYREGKVEGIYVRIDEGKYNKLRGKIVRPDFVQGIDVHFTKQKFVKNVVRYS